MRSSRGAELQLNAWQFLLFLNLVMILLGMFIDGLSLLLIVLPVILPSARALGIDLYHLAVVMTLNIEIAVLTPPVGLNLYVLAQATGLPLERLLRAIWPFILLMVALLVLFTHVPAFSTWLPQTARF